MTAPDYYFLIIQPLGHCPKNKFKSAAASPKITVDNDLKSIIMKKKIA